MKQLNKNQVHSLVREEQYEAERQEDLNNRMKSLVCSKEVPLIFKIGIPITIFGNIALFLSGHLSLGGTVNISGSFAGQDFNIEGFFEFSMVKSTIDMWLAGAKELVRASASARTAYYSIQHHACCPQRRLPIGHEKSLGHIDCNIFWSLALHKTINFTFLVARKALSCVVRAPRKCIALA